MGQDMSIIALDVDGSFSNPVMQVAVLIWAAVLACVLTFAFLRVGTRWQRVGLAVLVAAFGCLSSPYANRMIGMLIYAGTANSSASVGIIGGPPFWLSTFFAFAFTGAATVVVGRVHEPHP
jgi:hypothetical protein